LDYAAGDGALAAAFDVAFDGAALAAAAGASITWASAGSSPPPIAR